MTYKKDGVEIYTTFDSIAKALESNGWVADTDEVSLVDRVEALEGAVVDIATEVYR